MAAKSWWIKKRINPQFDHPYYSAMGQKTIKEMEPYETPLYGTNVLYKFKTEEEYNKEIDRLVSLGVKFV